MVNRYLRIWRQAALLNFSLIVVNRSDMLLTFLPAKILRMGFFFLFALSVFAPGTTVVGYSSTEALLFFAFMNLIDVLLQLFYRGLTDHPRIVKNGDFDFVLTKPIHPLFYSACRVFDLIDLITLPFALAFLGYGLWLWPGHVGLLNASLAIILLLLGFIIAFCLNIMIASLSFWLSEVSNAHWLYRDLVYVARFPPEIFPNTVRLVFTYLIPILVIVAFPAKALLGRLTLTDILWTFAITSLIMWLTRVVWDKGLQRYTSASS